MKCVIVCEIQVI